MLQDTIPTSLLKLNNDNTGRAVKMFAGIQKYMGESGDPMNQAQRTEVAQRLLHQGLKRPELKDELYMQVSSRQQHFVAWPVVIPFTTRLQLSEFDEPL